MGDGCLGGIDVLLCLVVRVGYSWGWRWFGADGDERIDFLGGVMIDPDVLSKIFERNYWVICRQVDGLTHEDSVLQLPFRGNCMNWVVGHIVQSRDWVLTTLGLEAQLSEAEAALYKPGSEPITDGKTAVSFERLLALLQASQEKILATLEDCTKEEMDVVVNEERGTTMGERLEFSAWHEAYHTGQLEILRQLAGTNDAVI